MHKCLEITFTNSPNKYNGTPCEKITIYSDGKIVLEAVDSHRKTHNDASCCRNLQWIVPVLQKMYDLGYEKGVEEGRETML